MSNFLDLGLAEPIARALADEQYSAPTPIQSQTIPQVLAARDVVGIAQTGTGKTAAFALPILHRLTARPRRADARACRVLVLSPTRELSAQIVDSFTTYGRYLKPRVALAIGGVPLGKQVRALTGGVDVLVATPGRLLDLLGQRAVRLDQVEILVLDEADRMLDMGFIRDIRRLLAALPKARQTLFFSATMPAEIAALASEMLHNPVEVAVTPAATTVERIAQRLIHVDRAGKGALLAEVLRQEDVGRTLVFTRTKRGADRVVRGLAQAGLPAAAIHGNKSQSQRERVLAAFRGGEVRTLVATDIAARGIDVEGITHVVNYDLPNVPESYVHRIGRTARAGADGAAISFCDAEERAYLRDIEKLIRMTIPATDRRSGAPAGSHRPAAPRPAPQPVRRDERPRAAAKPPQGGKHRGQQAVRSQQSPQRQQPQRPTQQRGQQQRPAQQRHQQSQRPPQRPAPAGADAPGIAAIAFMQQPVRRRDDGISGGTGPARVL